MALGLFLCIAMAGPVRAQQACTVECNLASGSANDYWPGTGNPAAGATAVTVGAQRTGAGTAGATLAAGDWIIVIQMQDANFQNSNTSAYGGNNGTGSGYTAANRTGLYEFARVQSVVGGTINLRSGLVNGYNTTLSGVQTTPRFQVVRVPNCVTLNLPAAGSLTGAFWNGETGGVVALRGETLNGNGATINALGIGFRGGATDAHNAPNNTNSYSGTNVNDQYKGEGIAATPHYVFDSSVNNEISTTVAPAMPGGYRGRGGAGNAGGGGEGDSGSGGGGNGGAGGRGGVWSTDIGTDTFNIAGGGRGGAPFAELGYNRVALGGGGGGGSSNESGATTVPETFIPQGVTGRRFNRGGAGGGIVILGASTRTGALTVNAAGGNATGSPYIDANQGSRVGGGGGAGGSIVIFGTAGGGSSITANAAGGTGYNDAAATGHVAHGGGGGGGAILAASLTGVAAAVGGGNAGCVGAAARDGAAGTNCNNTNLFASTSGAAGTSQAFGGLTEPGAASCGPATLSVVKDNGVTSLTAGQNTIYSISVVNSGPSAAPGVVVRDPALSGLNCSTVTFSATPGGAATVGALSISALQSTGIAITPTFNANSTATFALTCGVTATGQ